MAFAGARPMVQLAAIVVQVYGNILIVECCSLHVGAMYMCVSIAKQSGLNWVLEVYSNSLH